MVNKKEDISVSGMNRFFILLSFFFVMIIFTHSGKNDYGHSVTRVPYVLTSIDKSGISNTSFKLDVFPKGLFLSGKFSDIPVTEKSSYLQNSITRIAILRSRNLREQYNWDPIFLQFYHRLPDDNDDPPNLS